MKNINNNFKGDNIMNNNKSIANGNLSFNNDSVKSITNNLNELRKTIYGSFPNFEISEISEIISCINQLETKINNANTSRSLREKERCNKCNSKKVTISPRNIAVILTDEGFRYGQIFI